MTVPRYEIVAKVREWVAHADDDLRVAQHTLNLADERPYRLVAYHAQQCAEKYLKSYLVFREIDFPFTHNIARLLELCSQQVDWAERLHDAEELTPYAVTARYPRRRRTRQRVGSTKGCRNRLTGTQRNKNSTREGRCRTLSKRYDGVERRVKPALHG